MSEKLALATAKNARVSDELAELRTENQLLREKVEALIRRIFGAQSEQQDRAQLLLMLQGFDERPKSSEPVEAEAPRPSTAASPPRKRRQPRLPEHLPVVEKVILPEPVKAAPQQWRRIGEEVSERLDYEPARFLRRRTARPKYVERGVLDAVPVVAPLPDSLLERSLVAPGLLAQIVVSKILRSSSARPAGIDLLETPPSLADAAYHGRMGRAGCGMAAAHLPAHPAGSAQPRLCTNR